MLDSYGADGHRPVSDIVAQEGAGEKPGLAGDLESVADSEYDAARIGVICDLTHDRAETSDGAGPEVVAVREAAGQDDHVASLEVVVLVPEFHGVLAELIDDRVKGIVFAIGAREAHDADFHSATTPAISKSSVTGFASNRSHMVRTLASAAIASFAPVSMTR